MKTCTVPELAKKLNVHRQTVHDRLLRLGIKPARHGRVRVLTAKQCQAIARIEGAKK